MSADDERRERRAIVGLALASLPEAQERKVREQLLAAQRARAQEQNPLKRLLAARKVEDPPPTLGVALEDLTHLTDKGAMKSHRVLAFDLLAKMADRRGDAIEPVEGQLNAYVQAVVDEADRAAPSNTEVRRLTKADRVEPPKPLPRDAGTESADHAAAPNPAPFGDRRAPAIVDALRTIRDDRIARAPVTEHHWKRFVAAAGESGRSLLTEDEIHRPLCTDEQTVTTPRDKAVRTAVWFWSDRDAKEFEHWTDPRRWARDCRLFFKSVVPKVPPGPEGEEFSATFTETINLGDDADLSTDLVFSRSVEGSDLFALEFDLPPGPLPEKAQIVVDAGQVTVRHDPNAPESKRTVLLAEKYVRFKNPAYLTWPTIACDLFWTEFAITMALGCPKHQ